MEPRLRPRPRGRALERDFADYLGVEEVVGVSNSTVALQLTISRWGSDPVTRSSSRRTRSSPRPRRSRTWARPRVRRRPSRDREPGCLALPGAVTPNTRAIVPVHLYGQPADLEPILRFARGARVTVIEDACQAHGATIAGAAPAPSACAACFSFYPGKNLGAYGEGGAVATDDHELATQLRRLRDHGQTERYHHAEVGYNARMEGIQGAVLGVKLRHLDRWNLARRAHAAVLHAGPRRNGGRAPGGG